MAPPRPQAALHPIEPWLAALHQKVVLLLHGDASTIPGVVEHYAYVADISARYTFYKGYRPLRLTLEDLTQQAQLILLETVHRVSKSGVSTLADINTHPKYGCCLGLRPYLITTIRRELSRYISYNNNTISIGENVFRADAEKKYKVVPVVPTCISWYLEHAGMAILPSAEARVDSSAEAVYTAKEIIEGMHLTTREKTILRMSGEGYSQGEIAEHLNTYRIDIVRRVAGIREKYIRWRHRVGD